MRKPDYQQLPVVPFAQGERQESIPLSPGAHDSLPIKLQLLEKVQVCDSVMYLIGLFFTVSVVLYMQQ